MVFPIVTLDTALIQLAKLMDSAAFRVLATALFVFLLIAYLANWVLTIWSTWKGDLLFPDTSPHDEDEHKGSGDKKHDSDTSDGPFA